MTDDRRTRPWRKLRVIVEVTVPPNSRARERDLVYMVHSSVPETFKLPRPIHADARECAVRVKTFSSFWPAFLRIERGLNPNTFKKVKVKDDNNGL